ncbi:MAG: DUF2384 domain-containing protein [Gemmataceae bacterium]|nr:DUF2384 domain-containing protein [Gemmataceae bacterium]
MIATKKAPGWSLGLSLKEADSAHRAALAGLNVQRLDRFVATSGFTLGDVIGAMKLAPATLARRRASGKLRADESEHLLRLAILFEQAADLFGGSAQSAREWLQTPARGLGGEIPWCSARTTFGARMVEDLIGRLQYGVYT